VEMEKAHIADLGHAPLNVACARVQELSTLPFGIFGRLRAILGNSPQLYGNRRRTVLSFSPEVFLTRTGMPAARGPRRVD